MARKPKEFIAKPEWFDNRNYADAIKLSASTWAGLIQYRITLYEPFINGHVSNQEVFDRTLTHVKNAPLISDVTGCDDLRFAIIADPKDIDIHDQKTFNYQSIAVSISADVEDIKSEFAKWLTQAKRELSTSQRQFPTIRHNLVSSRLLQYVDLSAYFHSTGVSPTQQNLANIIYDDDPYRGVDAIRSVKKKAKEYLSEDSDFNTFIEMVSHRY